MATATLDLSPMQEQAVTSIEKWYSDKKSKQTYFLGGYAGTGKSTLVEYVISKLGIKKNHVEFACYTGKAALVLTQKAKGKYKASTIHRLIYELDSESKGMPQFVLKSKDQLAHLKLIVIDEASMVDGEIMNDLKSFGIKILFVGDPGQLPPVSQKGSEDFLEMFNNPDFVLTEIHRQAHDNPIIYLSMLARTRQPIPYGQYGANGEALVISKMDWLRLKEACYTTADQIICGYNKTRQSLNQDIRSYIGYATPYPVVGDKMICTRNDWSKNIQDINLVNGMTGYVKSIKELKQGLHGLKSSRACFQVEFTPDFTDEYFKDINLLKDPFDGVKVQLGPGEYGLYNDFDYGYAITCHKSQGSQWDNVVVLSEVLGDGSDHHRWLYTAITRSASKLVLVI